MPTEFENELRTLLNRHGIDTMCNTPDHLLTAFLVAQLEAYRTVMVDNIDWHGDRPIGGFNP